MFDLFLSFTGMFFLLYGVFYLAGVGIAEVCVSGVGKNRWILSVFSGLFLITTLGSAFFAAGFSLREVLPYILGIAFSVSMGLLYSKKGKISPVPDIELLAKFSFAVLLFFVSLTPMFVLEKWTPLGICGDQVIWASWTRFLTDSSLPASLAFPFNPAKTHESWLNFFSRFGFHVIHGTVDLLLNWEPHLSLPVVTAFCMSLLPLSFCFACENFFMTKKSTSFLVMLIVCGNYFFLLEHFNSRASEVLLLAVLPMAFILTARSLEVRNWNGRLIAGLSVASFGCIYQEMLVIYVLYCFVYTLFSFFDKKLKTAAVFSEFFLIICIAMIFLIPQIVKMLSVFSISIQSVSTNSSGNVYSFVSLMDLFGVRDGFIKTSKVHIDIPGILTYAKAVVFTGIPLVTVYGFLKITDKRVFVYSVLAGGIVMGIYFRLIQKYPYGYYKILLNYSWIIIIGLGFGVEKAWSRHNKKIIALLAVYIPLLIWHQAQMIKAFSSPIEFVYVPDLVGVKEASNYIKKNIPRSEAVMVRGEARNVNRIWLFYFLHDYNLLLSEYSSYFRSPNFPFYRSAITEANVLVSKWKDEKAELWSERRIWENRRYILHEKKADILSHTNLKNIEQAKGYTKLRLKVNKKYLGLYEKEKSVIRVPVKEMYKKKELDRALFKSVDISLVHNEQPPEVFAEHISKGNWVTFLGFFPENTLDIKGSTYKVSRDHYALSIKIPSPDFTVSINSSRQMLIKPVVQLRTKPADGSVDLARTLPGSETYIFSGGYAVEGKRRWLKRRAVIILPAGRGDYLFIKGFIPLEFFSKKPKIRISISGKPVDTFSPTGDNFSRKYALPEDIKHYPVLLLIESSSSFVPDKINHLGDGRELSVSLQECRVG